MQASAADLDYVREPFAGGQSYRVLNPRIRDRFLAIINRMYGVRTPHVHKFPGAQPCSIMRQDLEKLGRDHYVVAEKTDGTRYLMLATKTPDNVNFVVLLDRSLSMRVIELDFDDVVFRSGTLFDGELVQHEYERRWMFQVFDLVCSGNEFRPTHPYIQRLKNARAIVDGFYRRRADDAFHLMVKRFYPTHKIEQLAASIRMHDGCRTDGLIFTPVRLYVKPYRNRAMFKWKEQTNHTIDALLRYNADKAARLRVQRAEQANRASLNWTPLAAVEPPPEATETSDNQQQRACDSAPAADILPPRRVFCRRRTVPTHAVRASPLLQRLVRERDNRAADDAARKHAAEQLQVDVSDSDDEKVSIDNQQGKIDQAQMSNQLSSASLSSSSVVSPSKIELGAFEWHVTNEKNELILLQPVDATLNHAFLAEHGLSVAAGDEKIVECCWDAQANNWRAHLIRTDRRMPNTEFTVQKTVQNISENITLDQIVAVARNNRPPSFDAAAKRHRDADNHNGGRRAARFQPANPFVAQQQRYCHEPSAAARIRPHPIAASSHPEHSSGGAHQYWQQQRQQWPPAAPHVPTYAPAFASTPSVPACAPHSPEYAPPSYMPSPSVPPAAPRSPDYAPSYMPSPSVPPAAPRSPDYAPSYMPSPSVPPAAPRSPDYAPPNNALPHDNFFPSVEYYRAPAACVQPSEAFSASSGTASPRGSPVSAHTSNRMHASEPEMYDPTSPDVVTSAGSSSGSNSVSEARQAALPTSSHADVNSSIGSSSGTSNAGQAPLLSLSSSNVSELLALLKSKLENDPQGALATMIKPSSQ